MESNQVQNKESGTEVKSTNENKKQIPLFGLTLDQLEPVFKSWVCDCLNGESLSGTKQIPGYLTRTEAARSLRVSLPTLQSYTKLGLLTARRIGKRVLYSESDLQEALKDIPTKLSRR
jgi:excisionase family DNA binding protein